MIKEKQTRRKKQFRVHRWKINGRTAEISQHVDDENHIHFKYAFYHHIDENEGWNMRKISKIQKNLRQFLYNYLVENGLRTNNYILLLDAPKTPKGDKVYIELQGYVPVQKRNLTDYISFVELTSFSLHNQIDD